MGSDSMSPLSSIGSQENSSGSDNNLRHFPIFDDTNRIPQSQSGQRRQRRHRRGDRRPTRESNQTIGESTSKNLTPVWRETDKVLTEIEVSNKGENCCVWGALSAIALTYGSACMAIGAITSGQV